MKSHCSRREFLGTSATLLGLAATGASASAGTSPGRLALLGCGSRGMRHLRTIRHAGQYQDLLTCDSNPDTLARAERHTGSPGFTDWQTLQACHPVNAALLAAPASVHTGVLPQLLRDHRAVFCDGPLAENPESSGMLLPFAESSLSHFALHPAHPWTAHAEAAATLIADGALGDLRWSQVCLPAGDRPRTSLNHEVLQALFPLFRATGATLPEKTQTLSAPATARTFSAFSTEFNFAGGHRMLLQCVPGNMTGLAPVIRGSRASLEFHAGELLLVREAHASKTASPVERIALSSSENSLLRWLASPPAGPKRTLSSALHAQHAACLALGGISSHSGRA